MFGNKKRDEKINRLWEVVGIDNLCWDNNELRTSNNIKELQKENNKLKTKLKALEDYLNIEYKEESTKGYVKKKDFSDLQKTKVYGKRR